MVSVRAATPIAGVPAKLGKYRIVGQLGRGGMADLYLAVAAGIGGFSKLHVLKLVRTDSFGNADAVQMFVNEARVTALLNHPNVVQTHEVGEDSGMVFMVMEYLDGQSLDAILAHSQSADADRFDIGLRLRTVSEILNGLHHAHELCDLEGTPLGLVHRDVTPHNIFVTYDGGIKLLDFGVAKITSATSPTRVGTIKGKIAYMAPEQVSNPGQITRAADIFQVGLILWEGVIGRGVWEGLSEYEVLLKLSSTCDLPLVPPPDADPELVRICQRATAWKPEDRYQTAEAFNLEIEAYMASRSLSVTAKQVGGYVATLFAKRRSEMRDAIVCRLKDVQSDPLRPSESLEEPAGLLIPGMLGRQPYTRSGQSSSSGAAFPAGTSPPAVPGVRQMGKWKKLALPALIVGTAVVAAALVGGWAATYVRTPTPDKATAAAAEPHFVPSVTKTEEVDLSLEVVPASARLFLDERPLPGNPFSGRVAKDGTLHAVRAEAQGYESTSLLIRFDADTQKVIRMAALSNPPSPAIGTRGSASRKGPSRTARKVATSREAPSPPRAKDTAGDSSSVKLDNSDPWK